MKSEVWGMKDEGLKGQRTTDEGPFATDQRTTDNGPPATDQSGRPNILIVDDVPANIRVLQATLMADYDLSAVINGADALRIAMSDSPDLILLDIMMPGMDGYEVCKRLKADPQTRDIPIIFITARSEEEEEAKGFELGAVDYVTKPFSPAIVRARIHTHLSLKRHRDHLEDLNRLLTREIEERTRSEEALTHVLKKQEISIELAKRLLMRVNGTIPRHTELGGGLLLFADAISVPCYAEGGDHFFVRTMGERRAASGKGRAASGERRAAARSQLAPSSGRTLISLRDQSGHEVSCVLRSIITDIIHHGILNETPGASVEETVSRLNDEICRSDIFSEEDFLTSVNAEIDHETLVMRYVSAGHPPFLLIRGENVRLLPEYGEPGANMPIAVRAGISYSAGSIPLQEGDRLIFHTDGLTEMPLKNRNRVIQRAEMARLTAEMVRGRGTKNAPPVSEIAAKLLRHVADMSGETVVPAGFREPVNTSADDITILFLEIENRKDCHEDVWKPADADDISERVPSFCRRYLSSSKRVRGRECFPWQHVRMVMTEALLNAWVHGNQQNPDKSLTLRWRFGNDFHFEVIDEGDGFDHEHVPDPTSQENITKSHGRGVFIIRHFSDHVRWKKGGRHLMTSFKRMKREG